MSRSLYARCSGGGGGSSRFGRFFAFERRPPRDEWERALSRCSACVYIHVCMYIDMGVHKGWERVVSLWREKNAFTGRGDEMYYFRAPSF